MISDRVEAGSVPPPPEPEDDGLDTLPQDTPLFEDDPPSPPSHDAPLFPSAPIDD